MPSTYPAAAGDTFVYAGQLKQAYQTFPEIVAPGTPSPDPVQTTTVNVTQTVTVATNQTFNATGGLTDLHSAESDALSSGLKTTTSTTDTYEALPAGGVSGTLLGYGSQYADEAGDTVSTLLSPADVLDELPETAGATWTNTAAATIDEAIAGDATGSAVTVVRNVAADGSYLEKTTYPPNYSAPGYTGVGDIQENADGSGLFSFTANGGTVTITYSPPEPQTTGPSLITVYEWPGTDTTGTTSSPTAAFQIPTWYGTTPALYGETDKNEGTVTVPAACALASSFPTTATALVQTINRTDTVLGYTEAETTTSYVAPGYGLLCATLSDVQTLYYDFNGDQAYVFDEQSPLQITTATQTLALQPGSLTASSATRSTKAHAITTAPYSITSALRARFDRSVRAAHRARLADMIRSVRLRVRGGVK